MYNKREVDLDHASKRLWKADISNLRRRFLLAIVVLALLFTSACAGISLSSKISADDQFSGSRVIRFVIPNAYIKSAFKGDAKDLDALIHRHLPDVLEMTYKENENDITGSFVLKFSSFDNYLQKLRKLYPAAEISFSRSHELFSKGVYYKENFTDQDLLQWLTDVLRREGLLSLRAGNLFKEDQITLQYGGQNFELNIHNGLASYENYQSFYPNELEQVSYFNENQTIRRELLLKYSADEFAKLDSNFIKQLQKYLPPGSGLEKRDFPNGSSGFAIQYTANDLNSLIAWTKELWDDPNYQLEKRSMADPNQSLSVTDLYLESLNDRFFCEAGKTKTLSSYYLPGNIVSAQNAVEGETATQIDFHKAGSDKLSLIQVSGPSALSPKLAIKRYTSLQKFSMQTYFNNNGHVENRLTLMPFPADRETLDNVLKALEDEELHVSLDSRENKGEWTYTYTIKADNASAMLSQMRRLLAFIAADYHLEYNVTYSGLFGLRRELKANIALNFADKNPPASTENRYEIQLGRRMQTEAKSSTMALPLKEGTFQGSFTASGINLSAVLIIIGLVLLALLLLLILLRNLLRRKRKPILLEKAKAASAAAPPPREEEGSQGTDASKKGATDAQGTDASKKGSTDAQGTDANKKSATDAQGTVWWKT